MPNRIFPPYTPQKSPPFGLVGWLEQTRVQLPLKGVECRFHVCGDLLGVELDQIFHQHNAQPMDCLYTFPLPAGAAVHRCEMHVNGRVIRARVEEQERAREIAREQKAAGRRTALVEMERENLFTLSLGNLQPGDVIVIRFAYFQTLTRLADWTSLRIPFCPGVRYIPGQPLLRALRGQGVIDDTDQVPDASRLSPPRLDALHPDAAYLSVQGVIENPPGVVGEISSPSHPVLVEDGTGQWSVTLAQQGAVPDCDFTLRWTETRGDQMRSAAWALRDGATAYALVFLQAPRVSASVEPTAQDFYFLVDRSGSMEGLKWEKAVQSFRAFLGHLGPDDRAWATFFNEAWRDFAEKPLTARELSADTGLASLEKLGASGGTELLPAVQHVLKVIPRHSDGRNPSLIVITDGQVGNEAAILDCFRAHPNLRVHAFGIDTAVNDALLARLAAQQHGSACLLQPTDDIVGAVTRLGPRLRSPVLTNLTVGDGWQLPAGTVPDLHSEECVSLALHRTSADAREVVLRGKLHGLTPQSGAAVSPAGNAAAGADCPAGSAPTPREAIFHLALVERAEPAIRLLWASQRIRFLLEQGQRAEAIALGKQHNLLCDGAAFIAWDEAEQVPVAQREIYQPSFESRIVLGRLGASSRGAGESEATLENLVAPELDWFRQLAEAADPPPGLPPKVRRYRHDIMYAMSPQLTARRRLEKILARRPKSDGAQFLRAFGHRLGDWYQRFTESYAFHGLASGGHLVELLMEWVVDGAAEAERRMQRLEQLVDTLETKAPTPEVGLDLTRDWIARLMAVDDAYRQRAEKLLRDLAERVAEIRQRERKEGTRIL